MSEVFFPRQWTWKQIGVWFDAHDSKAMIWGFWVLYGGAPVWQLGTITNGEHWNS